MAFTPGTRGRNLLLEGLVVVLVGSGFSTAPSAAGTALSVRDASSAQAREVTDAVDHFRAAGLELPPLQIAFHEDASGCQGRPGYYQEGTVDVCTGATVNRYSETLLIHEMAHAWSERALNNSERRRFMDLVDVPTWSSWDMPWRDRGWEYAAEIIRWGIYGVTTPRVPYRSIGELENAYEFLTGDTPPILGGTPLT